MKTLASSLLIVALGLVSACSVMETKPLAREELRNAQGHVIGYKDSMRDVRTGEELARIALFVPRLSERGEIVGYKERVRGGTVLRNVNGKRIGERWLDARTRATNPQSKGLVIVVQSRAGVARAPEIEELVQLARLAN